MGARRMLSMTVDLPKTGAGAGPTKGRVSRYVKTLIGKAYRFLHRSRRLLTVSVDYGRGR
jgi:hypothetical protein